MTDSQGKEINDANPLKIDPTTKLSDTFTLSGYDGSVAISNLPADYEIVDKNGNKVSSVESGQQYRVKYTGTSIPSGSTATDAANEVKVTASYEKLADAKCYSAQIIGSPDENNPFQNMVSLNTEAASFVFPVILCEQQASSSSSSEEASSSEVSSSSVASSAKNSL